MSARGIRSYGRIAFPAGLLLTQCIACVLHAQDAPGYTRNDFGEVGLIQTQTARIESYINQVGSN